MSTTEPENLTHEAEQAAPRPEARKVAGTEYVILNEVVPDGGWHLVEESVTAASAEDALRRTIPPDEHVGGQWVAIPTRSWKPTRVSVETVSRVKLEDA